jgi:hypothetical protein
MRSHRDDDWDDNESIQRYATFLSDAGVRPLLSVIELIDSSFKVLAPRTARNLGLSLHDTSVK